MAYTTIDDPSAHFQVVTYTGGGNSSSVTFGGNSDLQLDWLWVKRRDSTDNSKVFDTSRGIGSGNEPYLTTVSGEEEQTYAYLTSVDSDGFTWDTVDSSTGTSSNTYVAWGWKANGGTRTTNTESGDNPAGGYQANTTAGFSIVDYTGTGGNGTMAHGLGAVPTCMIVKNRDQADSWQVYHVDLGNNKSLFLDNSDPVYTLNDIWNQTTPTSSVFTIGTSHRTNADAEKYIAYCFTPIQGYSKFGSYKGNGNADGTFVYLGFKPAYIIVKATDADEWRIYDHKRANDFNVINVRLKAHTNAAESQDDNECDFLSNGVKWRSSSGGVNSSGQEYIYLAFAEHPFVSSKGIPTTAR